MLIRKITCIFVLASFASQGCSDEFPLRSRLIGPRVLALIPVPLEAGRGEEVVVTPHIYVGDDPVVSEAWSFCPISAGARTSFACGVPECEVPLTPAADGTVSAVPSAVALICLLAVAEAGMLPFGDGTDTSTAALEGIEFVETLFRYKLETASGTELEAIARVPLYFDELPVVRNRPPVFSRVEVGGTLVETSSGAVALPTLANLNIALEIDPDSLDRFTDVAGDDRLETSIVSLFTTAGEFDRNRKDGTSIVENLERADDEPIGDRAVLYFVARDGRGGQAVVGPIDVTVPN